jgi:hypothetical protein
MDIFLYGFQYVKKLNGGIIMPTPKNVQIPYEDFRSLLDLLEYIDVSNYDDGLKVQSENILYMLKEKEQKLAARDAYSQLIQANKSGVEDRQLEARVNYLQKRSPSSR